MQTPIPALVAALHRAGVPYTLTAEEVRVHIYREKVSISTIYRMIESGHLPPLRNGRMTLPEVLEAIHGQRISRIEVAPRTNDNNAPLPGAGWLKEARGK